MNNIKIFENPEFGSIRTVEQNGEPWLAGKDVAAALGYSNPRDTISKHVDDEDKGVAKCDTLGGNQNMTVINESGLYSLILSSKLPTAIADKLRRLTEICEQYPNAIPVDVVAKFNGTHPESLRNSLKEGTCPFGYAWNRGSRSGFCIPTVRFYLWITGGGGVHEPD